MISGLANSGHPNVFLFLFYWGTDFYMRKKKIKGPYYMLAPMLFAEDPLDLSGMQCRWDRIKPPKIIYEVVSLLAIARNTVNQSLAFKKVIDSVDAIYGTAQSRTPVTVENLRLKSTLAKLGLEVRTRMGGFNIFNLLNTWIRTNLGYLYYKTRKGKVYLRNLVSMSDTLVIDGRINTVISGTAEQREMLVSELNKLEATGEIIYGLHVSKESVISCYVRNVNDKHIHFIDGAEGGYTKAAGMIKRKIIL